MDQLPNVERRRNRRRQADDDRAGRAAQRDGDRQRRERADGDVGMGRAHERGRNGNHQVPVPPGRTRVRVVRRMDRHRRRRERHERRCEDAVRVAGRHLPVPDASREQLGRRPVVQPGPSRGGRRTRRAAGQRQLGVRGVRGHPGRTGEKHRRREHAEVRHHDRSTRGNRKLDRGDAAHRGRFRSPERGLRAPNPHPEERPRPEPLLRTLEAHHALPIREQRQRTECVREGDRRPRRRQRRDDEAARPHPQGSGPGLARQATAQEDRRDRHHLQRRGSRPELESLGRRRRSPGGRRRDGLHHHAERVGVRRRERALRNQGRQRRRRQRLHQDQKLGRVPRRRDHEDDHRTDHRRRRRRA